MRASPPPEEGCGHDDHRARDPPRPGRPRLRSPHALRRVPGDGRSARRAGRAAHARRRRARHVGRVRRPRGDTAARLATLGVGPGDTVGLLLTMRPEVAWVDTAAMHLGAAGLSLYLAGTPAAHAYVLDDADVRVLVTERSLAGLAPGLRRACPKLEHVVRSTATRRASSRSASSPPLRASISSKRARPWDRMTRSR